MAFSPDGSKLALASADTTVYVYDAKNGFSLLFTCEGHASGVAQVDFSLDSQFIQSCSAQYVNSNHTHTHTHTHARAHTHTHFPSCCSVGKQH